MMWPLMITPMKTEHMITLNENHTITKANLMKVAMLMLTRVTITAMATEVMKVTSKVLSVTQKILFIAPHGQKRSTCTIPCSI